MGPCQSKSQTVASTSGDPPPSSSAAAIERQGSNKSLNSKASRKEDKQQQQRKHSKSATSPQQQQQQQQQGGARQRNGTASRHYYGPTDAKWEALWQIYHFKLIDPADVHAVLEECISHQINQLSGTELVFLERHVRHVVQKSLGSSSGTKKSRFYSNISSTSEEEQSKTVAEKMHLLDEFAIRKVLPQDVATKEFNERAKEEFWKMLGKEHNGATTTTPIKRPKPNGHVLDCIGCAYQIMLALSSTNWDWTAQIAVETASTLNMDVNHHHGGGSGEGDTTTTSSSILRAPPLPLPFMEQSDQVVFSQPGVNFNSLAYVMALALRGTRPQKLHLLYHLLLPPKVLKSFMATHPAGGVPTWLLEFGTDTILSVASLAHYYYHGSVLLPNSEQEGKQQQQQHKGLRLEAIPAVEALAAHLFVNEQAIVQESLNEAVASSLKPESPSRSNSTVQNMFLRRGSNTTNTDQPQPGTNESSAAAAADAHPKAPKKKDSTCVEYLKRVGKGQAVSYKDPQLEECRKTFVKTVSSTIFARSGAETTQQYYWTMQDFFDFCETAVNDHALYAIMHRMFAKGLLVSWSAEKELVVKEWIAWQQTSTDLLQRSPDDHAAGRTMLSQSMTTTVPNAYRGGTTTTTTTKETTLSNNNDYVKTWGGLGGYDDRGGLGFGIMYCIDKKWWDAWQQYVGWSWSGTSIIVNPTFQRPPTLSTERLLDRTSESVSIPGILGSYQAMKSGLTKGVDYVLVPPGVWDLLYELYGGGPPLPRMVLPPERPRTFSADSKQMEEEDFIAAAQSNNSDMVQLQKMPLKIPAQVQVVTHPWVLTAQVCDAQQPYRRGEAGPTSIRTMVTPDQPLSRLYAELVTRLYFAHPRACDSDGFGRSRLWKRVDVSAGSTKDGTSRYGPWSLLCKNRYATLPIAPTTSTRGGGLDDLESDWEAYADHATVESIGLADGDRLLVEYAVLNKNGEFVWPREAAAKAGRVRHLAAEDAKFRQLLRGVDEEGNPLDEAPNLVGMSIDAMDASGRWYLVKVLLVQNDDEGGTDESEQETEGNDAEEEKGGSSRKVRVDFTEHGGHFEWIDVDSDRLAKAGRFTMASEDDGESIGQNTSNTRNDAKSKLQLAGKKSTDASSEQNGGGKVCTYPGYGACGLANLGNTCYANAALQCISYMPLLRSYLLSGQYKTQGDLNKDNPLGTGGKLLEEFADLLRVMWSGKYGERTPTRFRSQLGKARSQFSGADQQDAQELLSDLLDVLHEDSNKVKRKPYVEALEDDWVKRNKLSRVGQEAWRRFLRRNRSIMADVTMGQILNTVTCPTCQFSSRSFDAFNILSLPFPTVADVVFQCTVVRRASALNCPQVLNRSKKSERSKDAKSRLQPPSVQLVFEQYVIAMSRLADIGDLRLQLQNICGIPANRFKLCRMEEAVVDADAPESSPLRTYIKTVPLPDKEGPCVNVAKRAGGNVASENGEKVAPTQIVAFESTINLRPSAASDKSGQSKDGSSHDESSSATEEEEEDDLSDPDMRATSRSRRERRALIDIIGTYGDSNECRVYDSDPLPISKAISRCLWPETEKDFKLGLRVDAIDHKNHWFPGSVVEIVEGVATEHGGSSHDNENGTKTKVRIHFDYFSSKWDETYTIDQFTKGQVRPLYSHATPRPKPTEFVVYHRYFDKKKASNTLFGRGFYLQCQSEWSTARAGAHILAQASRFITRQIDSVVDVDDIEKHSKIKRFYEKAYAGLSDLIDLLIDYDRRYMRSALGLTSEEVATNRKDIKSFRNLDFDASTLSTSLIERVRAMLYKLPFEVRVCTADAPMGSKTGPGNEEVPFPFSLMRTIGNFMNPRHAVVLHWRDPHQEKKSKSQSMALLNLPIMYVKPDLVMHKSSFALLNDDEERKSKSRPGSGGLDLGVCLAEFCKTQQLQLKDEWKCPRCKEHREGKQHMSLWKLPDVLTFHFKRFNCSARWREKITTKINFPLNGLDLSEWYHRESPAMNLESDDSHIYDLIGVLNHYGGMTGGHYVATCKATLCSPIGSEEVAHVFNGAGTNVFELEEETGNQTGWRLGRSKDKESSASQQKVAAVAASKAASESAEPLWLQFDDELVEPIPPRSVASETAYVLFYRRRHMTPSNIAKYSTIV